MYECLKEGFERCMNVRRTMYECQKDELTCKRDMYSHIRGMGTRMNVRGMGTKMNVRGM